MPRAPISKPAILRGGAAALEIVAGETELDRELGVYTLFLDIPRFEVVYFRLVLESWEDCAVARTVERFRETDRTRTLVVALVVPDFIEPALRRITRLCAEIDGVQVRATPALLELLRKDLLGARADPDN